MLGGPNTPLKVQPPHPPSPDIIAPTEAALVPNGCLALIREKLFPDIRSRANYEL